MGGGTVGKRSIRCLDEVKCHCCVHPIVCCGKLKIVMIFLRIRRGAMGLNSNPKAGVRAGAQTKKRGGTTGLRPGFPAFDGNSMTVIRWFIVFKVPKHRDIIVTANIVIIVTLNVFPKIDGK